MSVKMSERKELATIKGIEEGLGSSRRTVVVPEEAEVQKELFLSRLPA
jgi:hypothetical protein